ncbi:MAG: aminotransferase class V-fold PLP-dependent enzyme [Rhodobacteraceae bacterium]|nr:aminotransferase class V-fold PLP-dependent enzyme [Paracoccaceae bacterium]
MSRAYLDWNATAPLRPEARAAMFKAMDCLGNPSSVHGEGRAARAIVERAREQVSDAIGASVADIIFTSSATEAAALALDGQGYCSPAYEHSCVLAYTDSENSAELAKTAWQQANGETGIIHDLPEGLGLVDAVQAIGKVPYAFDWSGAFRALVSAHKFGGPKGAGALVVKKGIEVPAALKGGGQEMGRRSGTENVIGIAGMGAAAKAAAKDLEDGLWQIVEQNRNVFEERLLNEVPELIIFGKDVERLPNTSYFAVKGWKAETQVMLMDLAGFAVSAGSACSSGKVKASRVLKAMGYDEITASSAIRVSIGPSTTAAELDSFATAWLTEYKRFKARREGK